MHTVDVVIPLCNCEQYIRQSIESVQKQTVEISNIIVVDDGSTDSSFNIVTELAQKDKRILLLRGPNQGPSIARNKGILASQADFIAFLDADDLWSPSKTALQIQKLSEGQVYSFVHTAIQAITTSGNVLDDKVYMNNKHIMCTFDTVRLGTYAVVGSASSVMVRRTFFAQSGLFDEQLRWGEDWDMWARLAAFAPVAFVDVPLVFIRVHPNSLQRSATAEMRARQRLHSRIMVARHWESDAAFMDAHKSEARKDAWAAMRWLLLKPAALYKFYMDTRNHHYHAGKIIFSGPIDFILTIIRGLGCTVVDVLRSPKELQRLWNRFITERQS